MSGPQFIHHMQRLSKIVPPKREIPKNINLSFYPGAKIGVAGANGPRKSSLLRIMAGIGTAVPGAAGAGEGQRRGERGWKGSEVGMCSETGWALEEVCGESGLVCKEGLCQTILVECATITPIRTILNEPTLSSVAVVFGVDTCDGEPVAGLGREDLPRPAGGTAGLTTPAPPAPRAPGAGNLHLRPLAGPALMSQPPAPSAQACRLSCAQTYYFCLAEEASDECPQAWGQCRLGCGPGVGPPA